MEEDPNLFIFVYEETNVFVKDSKQDYVLREPTINQWIVLAYIIFPLFLFDHLILTNWLGI